MENLSKTEDKNDIFNFLNTEKKGYKKKPFDKSEKVKTSSRILSKWSPKTKLGLEVKQGKYKDLHQVLTQSKIVEPQVADYFGNLSIRIVDVSRVSHTLKSGKVYQYRVTVLVGKEGLIGCGKGSAVVKALAVKKAVYAAKKELISLASIKKANHYTPMCGASNKKGATLVSIYPLIGGSVTASKLGRTYCELCNIKGIKITTGNKKRLKKGKVGSKLNYYTALHEAITLLIEKSKNSDRIVAT